MPCEYLKSNTCQIDKDYCTVPKDYACEKRVNHKSKPDNPKMSDNEKCQNEGCGDLRLPDGSRNCYEDAEGCTKFTTTPTTSIPTADLKALQDKIADHEEAYYLLVNRITELQDKIAELEGRLYSLDDYLNIAMDIAFTHGQSWGQTTERIGVEHFKTEDQSKRYARMKKEVLGKTKARK